MNLVIDLGNTHLKLAVFKGKELKNLIILREVNTSLISSYIEQHKEVKSVIYSSVAQPVEELTGYLKKKFSFLELDASTPLPVTNEYATKATLGNDRIAAAVGAASMFPRHNVLAIDIGTCIKYDFVTFNNEYLGGAISPGIEMRLKALHTFTKRLPLTERKDFNELIGRNTEESILSGVYKGSLNEVRGIISEYRNKYKDLKIILSGGDMVFFEKALKTSTFSDPHLVLRGLNIILNYNREKISRDATSKP